MVTRVTKRDVIVALGLLSLPSLGQRNVEILVDRKALSNLLDPFLGTDGKRLCGTEFSSTVISLCALTISSLRPSYSLKQEVAPTQEDHRARFYDDYRKVAKEYDKEFLMTGLEHDLDIHEFHTVFVASC